MDEEQNKIDKWWPKRQQKMAAHSLIEKFCYDRTLDQNAFAQNQQFR